jgi:3-oxoacyl-[acyl-carrier-protein] synthase II
MQFACVAGDEALRRAGLDPSLPSCGVADPDRFGVVVGSGIGGFPEICQGMERMLVEGAARISPLFIPGSLINLATGNLSIRYGARGPSSCPATACASSNHALGEAFRLILLDEADVVVAGGAEAALSPLGYGGFMTMRALSRRNETPESASRPFDRTRDGFVMAEGAGILVLEALDHALGRGATPLAELIGFGNTTDAHHVTAPAPEGLGAQRCMRAALRVAGLDPQEVDYINAHGTGTPANDPTEVAAIRAVFGPHADRLLVSSTKGATGHLLGAAGGVEAVASVLALSTGWVPPTANLAEADPACDLDHVPGTARLAHPRVALSNAFGFGGTNAVVAFRRWEGR